MTLALRSFLLLCFFSIAYSLQANEIKAGDKLQIVIRNVPQSEQLRLNSMYTVSKDGFLTMWKIGKIEAAGKSCVQVNQDIAKKYKELKIYGHPSFEVLPPMFIDPITERITVAGEVNAAGVKPWIADMTLYDAVQAAGGASGFAALNRVKLYRSGKVFTYDLTKLKKRNVNLFRGDSVEIPKREIKDVIWHGFDEN